MPGRRRTILTSLALVAVVLIAYCGAWRSDFVHYDDNTHVFGNPQVSGGLSAENIGLAFGQFNGAQWIPLTWISFMMDISLFGLTPGAMHGVNVLLHATNAVLLLALLLRLTGKFWPGALVAGLFALHPVNVESVAWISERKNVLSTLFWLSGTMCYLRYTEKLRRGWMLATFICLGCGLMVKAMLVTLPFTLLLLDCWPLGRRPAVRWARLVLEKLPLFALVAIASWLQLRAAAADHLLWNSPGGEGPGFAYRAANAGANILHYLASLLVPLNLAPMYALPLQAPVLLGALGWFLAALTIILAWRLRVRAPWLLFGFLWFLGTQVPVSGIIGAGDAVRCDRYLYIPEIGIFIAVVWSLNEASKRWSPAFALAGSTAVLGIFFAFTHAQTRHWQNSTALFTHAAQVSPESVVANKLAGWSLARDGRLAESRDYYRAALALAPELTDARLSLGVVMARMGQSEQAVAEFRRILNQSPSHGDARMNLGVQLFATGANAEALAELSRAANTSPENPKAHYWLGRALEAAGLAADATRCYQLAAKLDPGAAGLTKRSPD